MTTASQRADETAYTDEQLEEMGYRRMAGGVACRCIMLRRGPDGAPWCRGCGDPAPKAHRPPQRDPVNHPVMVGAARRYLPTLSDLIDRMSIVQLKAIFLPEKRAEYLAELKLIEHDVDMLMSGRTLSGESVRAILVVMLANRYIWENESKARAGGDDQDKLLKLTHSINGVRNNAKNVLAREFGERLDWKVDCFAAELVAQFGNWNVFDAAE